jgi:hypothetical protein
MIPGVDWESQRLPDATEESIALWTQGTLEPCPLVINSFSWFNDAIVCGLFVFLMVFVSVVPVQRHDCDGYKEHVATTTAGDP